MGTIRERLSRVYELEATPGRIPAMEGYRGLAILLVFFVHFDSLFGDYAAEGTALRGALGALGRVGNVGVDLFFVASGYLIYGAVVRKPIEYAKFFRRRVERIYPTFVAVFAAYVALSYAFPERSRIPKDAGAAAGYLAQNFFLLPGIARVPAMITVAWSLSYEFFYYLTIPVLVGALSMQRWRPAARGLAFGAVGAGFLVYCFLVDPFRDRLTLFVAGILLYETMQSRALAPRVGRAGEWAGLAFVAASFAFVVATYERAAWVAWLPGFEEASGTWRVLAMSLCFYVFAFLCFAVDGFTNRVFCAAPLRWLGNMSYSYYLVHGLALLGVSLVFHRFAPPGSGSPALLVAALAVGFAATVALSTALFLLVEKPYSLTPRPRRAANASTKAHNST